jgi:hypothetical protein
VVAIGQLIATQTALGLVVELENKKLSINFWVKDWRAMHEISIPLAIILHLSDRSFHGINRISPVKIQNLLSIQLWRAAWCSIRGKRTGRREGGGAFSKRSFENLMIIGQHCASDVSGHGAQWRMFDIGRLKVQLGAHKIIIGIRDIKHIRNIMLDTFVMMLGSFLASPRDAEPCVR